MAIAKNNRLIYQKIMEYTDSLAKNHIPVWRLYLYGSYAKGTARPDSDIDLAVCLDKDEIDGFREDVELMRLRWEIDLRIEPHAFARSDLDETNPYIWEIIHTGERIV